MGVLLAAGGELSWKSIDVWELHPLHPLNPLNCCVWRCRYLCRISKIGLFRALVLPVLLYGGETWSIGAPERGRLSSLGTRALRRSMGYRWDNFFNNRVLRETGISQVTSIMHQRLL